MIKITTFHNNKIISREFDNLFAFHEAYENRKEYAMPQEDDLVIEAWNDNEPLWSVPLKGFDNLDEMIKYVKNLGFTFNHLLYLLGVKTNIPAPIKSKLLSAYLANREDLDEIRHLYNKYEYEQNPSESFEQGYNNAFEYVFRILGVDYKNFS